MKPVNKIYLHIYADELFKPNFFLWRNKVLILQYILYANISELSQFVTRETIAFWSVLLNTVFDSISIYQNILLMYQV